MHSASRTAPHTSTPFGLSGTGLSGTGLSGTGLSGTSASSTAPHTSTPVRDMPATSRCLSRVRGCDMLSSPSLQGVGLGESSAVVDHAIARTSSSRAAADAACELLAELLGVPSFELAEPYAGGFSARICGMEQAGGSSLRERLHSDCLCSAGSDIARVDRTDSPVAA